MDSLFLLVERGVLTRSQVRSLLRKVYSGVYKCAITQAAQNAIRAWPAYELYHKEIYQALLQKISAYLGEDWSKGWGHSKFWRIPLDRRADERIRLVGLALFEYTDN